MNRKPPTGDDIKIWQDWLDEVKPLKHKNRRAEGAAAPARKTPVRADKPYIPRISSQRSETRPAKTGPLPATDSHTKKRIRRGQQAIDATLDLHGMRAAEAQDAVIRFLEKAQGPKSKTILIITGKGRGGAEGILRRTLPHWLDAPQVKHAIISFSPAAPQHGGDGAFYVVVRKKS